MIAALTVAATHAMRPMVTYRALDLGASPAEVGLVQSAWSILPLLSALAIGRAVDRIGEQRIIIGGTLCLAVGATLAAVASDLLILATAQLVTGFGMISSAIALQALIANRSTPTQRIQRYGWYAVAVSIGQLVGPAVAAFLVVGAIDQNASGTTSPLVIWPAFAAALLASLVAAWVAARKTGGSLPASSPPSSLATSTARVLQRPGMVPAMMVSIIVTASMDVLIAYLPVYGSSVGLSVGAVGTLLVIRAAASLASRSVMGRLSEAIGVDRLLAGSAALAAIALLLLPAVSAFPVIAVLMIIIGLGLGIGQPMTVAWVAGRSEPADRGLSLSVRLTGNLGAMLVVPTAVGLLAGASGVAAIWLALGALLVAGSVIAIRTTFDEQPPPPSRALLVNND